MNKYPYKNTELTGWATSDARIEVACPRCKSDKGFYCETPKGRKAAQNHTERGSAYINKIGRIEFDKRHSAMQSRALDWFKMASCN
jgi:phage FluMu protein Com